jgi:aryl-alcohol dehydrogenase-like predicted oxidoreductase
MKYVPIPDSDLRVSRICLGSAEMGASITPKDSFALLDTFIAEGGNFIDTAHVYSDWIPNTKSTSEKLIGQWLKKSNMREDVVIATKGAHPALSSMNVSRMSKADIEQDITESLEYLQTEIIDLYWLHRDDTRIPVGEIIEILNEQAWLGNIRYFGCSNWTISRIQEAVNYAADKGTRGFVANQPLWSLAVADMKAIPDQTLVGMDDEGMGFHKRTQMAVIPYTSQAKGFFSKVERLGSAGLRDGDRKVYFSEVNQRRLLRAQELARKYQVTANDIALSYLISQPFVTIPVVGCRTIGQIRSSLKAVNVVLASEDVTYLEGA